MNPISLRTVTIPANRGPRVIVLGAGQRPRCWRKPQRLLPEIASHAEVVAADFCGSENLAPLDADLTVVFGGDGSILRAVHQMGKKQLPVIAVNLGKLGFLADVTPAELIAALQDFRAGKLNVIEHLMFTCRVVRGGETFAQGLG